jgi:glycosyltransferase involved in cell wall biosynthesis
MRIAILTREFEKETALGGIATFYKHLSRGLVDLGNEVEIFTQGISKPYTQVIDGITVHRVVPRWAGVGPRVGGFTGGMPLGFFAWSLARELYIKLLVEHNRRPFHVADVHEHLGIGVVLGIKNPLPQVVTLVTPYAMLAEQKLNSFKKDLSYFLIRHAENTSLRRSQVLRALSQDLGTKIKERYNLRRSIPLTYNPMDLRLMSPGAMCPDRTGRVGILCVGRLEQRKGVHLLAEAIPIVANSCPEAQFTFIGADGLDSSGSGSMKASLQSFFKASGIDNIVSFSDPVPYEELVKVYQSHDIVAVPSLYDNSPYSVQEGMSCAKPVVTFDSGGAREYLGVAGVTVKKGNIEELASVIITLVKDHAKRVALGKAARKRAEELFGKEAVARQSVALYEEAIALWGKGKRNDEGPF